VLKGHGKSDPEAVYNALRTGKLLMERNTIGAVKEELVRWREKDLPGAKEHPKRYCYC